MSWQWRKSKGLFGGLLRFNFGKKGVGVSVGSKRLRLSKGADGKTRRSISLPGGLRNTRRIK